MLVCFRLDCAPVRRPAADVMKHLLGPGATQIHCTPRSGFCASCNCARNNLACALADAHSQLFATSDLLAPPGAIQFVKLRRTRPLPTDTGPTTAG